MIARCPAGCGRHRGPGKYLCFTCWRHLPAAARKALDKRDGQAFARLRELHRQLEDGVPLADIQITGAPAGS